MRGLASGIFLAAIGIAGLPSTACAYYIHTQVVAVAGNDTSVDFFQQFDGVTDYSKSVTAHASCSAGEPPCSNINPPVPMSSAESSAFASANLASGELKAYANKGEGGLFGTNARVYSSFGDTIQILGEIPPEYQNDVLYADFILTVDGTKGGPANLNSGGVAFTVTGLVESTTEELFFDDLPDGTFLETLSITAQIYNPIFTVPLFDITISASIEAGYFTNVHPGFIDASNTAALSINLPSGLDGFTSDSGVLLTERASASVPEPSSAMTLAIGLLALHLSTRRQRRRMVRRGDLVAVSGVAGSACECR